MSTFDYIAQAAMSSLKSSMKSDIQLDSLKSDMRLTLENLKEDISFLKNIKERCTELTAQLAYRNVTLFKNKNTKDQNSIILDNIKLRSSKYYNYVYEFQNIMDENLDFSRRTCINAIDLMVNSHNTSTDYETRIIAIGKDFEHIIAIEKETDLLLLIKESLFIPLRDELDLEEEENEAMINAEIEASINFKRAKALTLRAKNLKAKAKQQADGLSIGAQTSKCAEIQAPLAVPEDIASNDLDITNIVISDKLEELSDASDIRDKSNSLKRNPTESMYNIGSIDKVIKTGQINGEIGDKNE